MKTAAPPSNLLQRFRGWLAGGVAVAALVYVGATVWVGVQDVGDALAGFRWSMFAPIVVLTLANYALRFWKWQYLLGRLDVRVPVRESATIFLAGLAMAISPGKAGELLKPYLVRARTGAPMAQTVPALVTERLTDGIACLALAGVSVGQFASDRAIYVWGPILTVAVALGVLMHRGLSMAILGLLSRLPVVSRAGSTLTEMYVAMRACVAPVPLAVTVGVSLLAWWGECVGYWLVFDGFGVDAGLDACTFLYAFATVAGGAMPGGIGVADGALVGGAMELLHVEQPVAVASALLARVSTLWLGVLLGAMALLRVGGLLEQPETRAEDAR
jgi:uncharacterized protein (TIRG00374 family)